MITVCKTFEWDMGHRVTNHESVCRNLHGHRYKMNVTIGGPMINDAGSAQEGMIIDFGHLKKLISSTIIDTLDHAFMYWKKDILLADFFKGQQGLKTVMVDFVPTAESIVQYIADKLRNELRQAYPDLRVTTITLFETPNSQATWHDN